MYSNDKNNYTTIWYLRTSQEYHTRVWLFKNVLSMERRFIVILFHPRCCSVAYSPPHFHHWQSETSKIISTYRASVSRPLWAIFWMRCCFNPYSWSTLLKIATYFLKINDLNGCLIICSVMNESTRFSCERNNDNARNDNHLFGAWNGLFLGVSMWNPSWIYFTRYWRNKKMANIDKCHGILNEVYSYVCQTYAR